MSTYDNYKVLDSRTGELLVATATKTKATDHALKTFLQTGKGMYVTDTKGNVIADYKPKIKSRRK